MAAQPNYPEQPFYVPDTSANPRMVVVGNDEYLTYEPTIYQWQKGEVLFRLVLPAGQNTDLASAPWWAGLAGFKKEDKRWHPACKVHDYLYFCIRHYGGLLPAGVYQYFNPVTNQWENIATPYWKRKEADQIFLKIMLEDGFPPVRAHIAYRAVRMFGGLHMKFSG